jgi:ABC-type uncharacterized transport system involved in gliding motility auxiliary subunit
MPKSGGSRYYRLIIYIIVVVLINIAGITLFFRIDLTSSRMYSLSEASRNAVATLSEPLTVKVFFNSNLPAPHNNTERYLHDLLAEYAISGGKYFNYQFYSVSGEEDEESIRNQAMAEDFGIQPVQIQIIEQDEVKFQRAYMGMAILHGDIIESIPFIDSTEGLEYQITSTIRKMNNKISALLRLEDNISVKLYLSSSLRAVGPYMNITGLASLPDKVKQIVNNLNNKNYGKLSFAYLDPTINQGLEQETERYNILQLNWNEFRDRQGQLIPADKGYAGIVIEHGDRFEQIRIIDVMRLPLIGTQYQLADLSELENGINETIENVIDINEEIGYLADHGTLSMSRGMSMLGQQQDSISSLHKLLSGQYSVRPVSLKEEVIPDGLSFLLIAGPKENFTDYELYQIDQFLMEGKNLAVFIDPFNEIRPQGQQGQMGQRPFYIPVNTGLERLLNHYGLDMRKTIILDENSYKQRVPSAFGGGEQQIYFAPIIENEKINKDVEYLQNIKGLVMLKASPLTVDEKKMKDSGLKVTELFSSSERSWELKDRIDLNPMSIRPPRDEGEFKAYPLAYILEGSFSSYFADKPVPFREEKEEDSERSEKEKEDVDKESGVDMSRVITEGTTIKKGKPGKVLLIGTSEILKDSVIDEGGRTPNAQFVMNVIDYLNGREDVAVMRSKTQKLNPLKEVDPSARTAIKAANIAGLPVMVVVAGLIVWVRRSARKRMIQRIFS